MRLAEALMLRSDLQKRFISLRNRVGQNAVVQDGERSHESPQALMEQAEKVLEKLEELVYGINRANARHALPDGRSLTQAVARRDTLRQRHGLLSHAIESAQKAPSRYGMAEIRWVATVNVAELQKKADELSQEIRELNAVIQECNWRVDLEQ